MEFNFRESFQSYSNVELLRIIDEADKYQPEAVEAARDILGRREVHDSDYETMNSFKTAVVVPAMPDDQTSHEDISAFLESLVKPENDPRVPRWINMLLLVQFLLWAWWLTGYAIYMRNITESKTWSMDAVNLLRMIWPVLYIPVASYLLYKRKRWGWILLTAFYIGTAALTISSYAYLFFASYFNQRGYHFFNLDIPRLILDWLIRAGIVWFLWKPAVAAYFNISRKAKRDTVVISICIVLAIVTMKALPSYFSH
ncbi:MAG TPA: hypothetical protein VGE90_01960 [Chitinophaga sp.]